MAFSPTADPNVVSQSEADSLNHSKKLVKVALIKSATWGGTKDHRLEESASICSRVAWRLSRRPLQFCAREMSCPTAA